MKGLSGMIAKFGSQYTEAEGKALQKLGTLKTHRQYVPLEGKAEVNRQGAIYRANVQVKKAFGLPGPQKKIAPPETMTGPSHASMKSISSTLPAAKPGQMDQYKSFGQKAVSKSAVPSSWHADPYEAHLQQQTHQNKTFEPVTEPWKAHPKLGEKLLEHGVSFEEIKKFSNGQPVSFDTLKRMEGHITDAEAKQLLHGNNPPSGLKGQAALEAAYSKTQPPKGIGLGEAINKAAASGAYGKTPEQRAALTKLGALKMHRDLVPMPYKTKEAVNRQGAIYRANAQVKKLFSDIAVLPPTMQEEAAGRAKLGLDKVFADLKAQGYKPPTPQELVAFAKEAGLPTHKIFVKATGKQISESQFTGLKSSHGKTIENPHVKSSILHYSASGYGSINGELRANKVNEKGHVELSSSVAQHVANIDHAIDKAKLKEDTKLYRGIGGYKASQFFKDLKPGDVYEEPAYSSTGAFKPFGASVKLVIHASKGQSAMAIPSEHSSEKEVLLPRNSRFRVLHTNETKDSWGDKKHEVHVQLLAPKKVAVTPPKIRPGVLQVPRQAMTDKKP